MSPIRLAGTLFIAVAIFALLFEILTKGEERWVPWPVALIVLALGVFFLRMAGPIGAERRRS